MKNREWKLKTMKNPQTASSPKSRQLSFGQVAFECVQSVQNEIHNPIELEEYGNFCKNLAVLIHTSGLLQIFLFAKKTPIKKMACTNLIRIMNFGSDFEKSLESLRNCSVRDYEFLTHQAIRAAAWLKRYVEALNISKTSKIENNSNSQE
jgi:CRISPR/Cas system CMR-associated protein Cmr5 small subunit